MASPARRSPPSRLKRSSPEPEDPSSPSPPRDLIPLANVRRFFFEETSECSDPECLACEWRRRPASPAVSIEIPHEESKEEEDLAPEVCWFDDELDPPAEGEALGHFVSQRSAGPDRCVMSNGAPLDSPAYEEVRLEPGLTYLVPRLGLQCEDTTAEIGELMLRIAHFDATGLRRPRLGQRQYYVVLEGAPEDYYTSAVWRILSERRRLWADQRREERLDINNGSPPSETPPYGPDAGAENLYADMQELALVSGDSHACVAGTDEATRRIGRQLEHMNAEMDTPVKLAPRYTRATMDPPPLVPLEDDSPPPRGVDFAGLRCYRLVAEMPPHTLIAAARGNESELLSADTTALEVRHACELSNRMAVCLKYAGWATRDTKTNPERPWVHMTNMPKYTYARQFRTPDEEVRMRLVRDAHHHLGLCEHAAVYASRTSPRTQTFHIEVLVPPFKSDAPVWDEARSVRARAPVDPERPTPEDLVNYTYVLRSDAVDMPHANHYTARYYEALRPAAEYISMHCPFCRWVRRCYRCNCGRRLFYAPIELVQAKDKVLSTIREVPRLCEKCKSERPLVMPK